jgi:intraflagellar transport protein 88
VKARAATNLSFLHFLEGDLENAEKYAELAVATDRYNARGLVNRGNVMMQREEYEQALTIYLEAVSVEADCTEAMFNLGLVNKRLGRLEDALAAFKKLNTILPHNIEVIYQVNPPSLRVK